MHMVMVIFGGIVLFGLFQLFAMLWGGTAPDHPLAAKVFIPVWVLIALANMWVGVTKAGYTVRDELPILGIVLAVPVLLAIVVIWRVVR